MSVSKEAAAKAAFEAAYKAAAPHSQDRAALKKSLRLAAAAGGSAARRLSAAVRLVGWLCFSYFFHPGGLAPTQD